MNWLKYDPDCYSCHREGWVIGESFKDLIKCPICKNSRLTRIIKSLSYNFTLKLFGFFYESLERINWVSDTVLEFHRLHNKDTRYRVSRKLLIEYASGYDVNKTLFDLALSAVAGKGANDLLAVATRAHHNAANDHKTDPEFVKLLDEMKPRR